MNWRKWLAWLMREEIKRGYKVSLSQLSLHFLSSWAQGVVELEKLRNYNGSEVFCLKCDLLSWSRESEFRDAVVPQSG